MISHKTIYSFAVILGTKIIAKKNTLRIIYKSRNPQC